MKDNGLEVDHSAHGKPSVDGLDQIRTHLIGATLPAIIPNQPPLSAQGSGVAGLTLKDNADGVARIMMLVDLYHPILMPDC
jgi:hypothetical protein